MEIGLITALIAGVLSFTSPCVLPIVPGYLSFITGMGLDQLTQEKERAKVLRTAFLNSVIFVIGFSIVFVLLGASATAVGQLLQQYSNIISKIAGVVLVAFGLHMIGVVKIPFLLYEKRIHQKGSRVGVFRSFLAGLFFAFGWSPCVGPILAGILALAASSETVQQGMTLLGVYSIGLGVPFILSAVFLNSFFVTFSKIRAHLRKVEVTGGVILVTLGGLIFFDKLGLVSQRLDFMNLENLLVNETVIEDPSININLSAADTSRSIDSSEIASEKYDFTLRTMDGSTLRLSDLKGKVVVVNFWAPWCGPCRLETPAFVKVYEKYKAQGLVIIGVAVQTSEKDVKKFIEQYKVSYVIGISDEAAEQYQIVGLPTTYFFDRQGRMVKSIIGYTPEAQFESLVRAIM